MVFKLSNYYSISIIIKTNLRKWHLLVIDGNYNENLKPVFAKLFRDEGLACLATIGIIQLCILKQKF